MVEEATTPSASATFLLLRATLPALSPQSTLCRFSGGIHAFLCMARALGTKSGGGKAVTAARVLSSAPRAALLRDGAEQGWLLQPGGSPLPSPWTPGVVRVEVGGVKHHVALTDADAAAGVEARAEALIGQWRERRRQGGGRGSSDPPAVAARVVARLPPAQAALMLEALELACRAPDGPLVVILNADGAQGSLGVAGQAPPTPTAPTTTLTEAVAAVFGSSALALVQNVHSLPFGPYGGAARGSDALQVAWGLGSAKHDDDDDDDGAPAALPRLGGAVAVSRFVRAYLEEHSGLGRLIIHVPLSAWGVFGAGPWPDFGGELAAQAAAAAASAAAGGQSPPPPAFAVALPKLTPEKGLGLAIQLARRLPDVAFVGVAAGAEAAGSASSLPSNLRLLPPAPSPDGALRGAALCLCPSLWREAYGMAAVDAALRGVPVAASRGCGGLTEAAALLPPGGGGGGGGEEDDDGRETWPARLLPVEFVRVPQGSDGDGDGLSPPWARREVPSEQPEAVVEAWAAAVVSARDELVSRPSEFARRSAETRRRAMAMVAGGGADLGAFLREVLLGQ